MINKKQKPWLKLTTQLLLFTSLNIIWSGEKMEQKLLIQLILKSSVSQLCLTCFHLHKCRSLDYEQLFTRLLKHTISTHHLLNL